MTLSQFQPNTRVRYLGRTQDRNGVPLKDQLATVIRPIKSRKVVHIRWDNELYPTFEANPGYLEILE